MDEEIDNLPEDYKTQYNIGYIIGNNDLYLANVLIRGFVRSNDEFSPINGLASGLEWGIRDHEKLMEEQQQELQNLRERDGQEREFDLDI